MHDAWQQGPEGIAPIFAAHDTQSPLCRAMVGFMKGNDLGSSGEAFGQLHGTFCCLSAGGCKVNGVQPAWQQLVCAYLVGMGVKKDIYQTIPVCMDSLSTGCFTSWRTFRNDYNDGWAKRDDSSIAVVNPITWKTTTEIANREKKTYVRYSTAE